MTTTKTSASKRARMLVERLSRVGSIDMLHETSIVVAEVNRLLEEKASRDVARLLAEEGQR